MNLSFAYTENIVGSLMRIERCKTALEYLSLPTREKQRMLFDAKLRQTHFSTSIEGNALSIHQVQKVIGGKNDSGRMAAEQEVQNYWDARMARQGSDRTGKRQQKDHIP